MIESAAMARKKDIPEGIRLAVFEEAGYQCAFCGHRDGLNLTVHHIKHERDEGKATYDNLIALCFNCHHRVDQTGSISEKDIRRLKRHLVHRRLTQAGMNALKLAYENPFGVIAMPFAVQHLVEEKLLEFIETQMWYGDKKENTIGTALYRITPKGHRLVEQWVL
jgi:hypothetical protein